MVGPTVIWQTRPGRRHNVELDYITDRVTAALPGRPEVVFDDARFERVADAAVVVVSCGDPDTAARAAAYLEGFPPGSRIAVIHLSGETPGLPVPFYARADLVLRNYYEPRFDDDPTVLCLPLGYNRGFWDRPSPVPVPPAVGFADRTQLWAFVGQLKSDRPKMVRQLAKIDAPSFVHLTSGWMSDDQLPIEEVHAVYERTVLVPCPFGWRSLDSFRVVEALEAGALPVVVDPDRYFEHVFPGHPFVVGRSWRDARRRVESMRRSGELADRWGRCAVWYPAFWADLHATLRERFAAVFGG
ncbi:MAG: hypothetical protein WDA60_01845 [Acidimicrobiia bacterium]